MAAPSALSTPLVPFELERYFALHEFNAPFLLCCSDMEPLSMSEVLTFADDEMKAKWDSLSLGYTESRGDPCLLEEVSKLYESVPAEGPLAPIICAPQEGVLLAMQAMLTSTVKERGTVICMAPAYQSLHEIARSVGCKVLNWEPELNKQGVPVCYSVQSLKSVVAAHLGSGGSYIEAVIVNFPHNPTGSLLSEQEMGQLVALCSENDAFLFCDEMYRLLEHDPADRVPSAIDMGYSKTVVLCGVSKSLSCPGLRIGWLVSTDRAFLNRVVELKDYSTICSSAPSEVLATIVLRSREAILSRNMEIIRNNLVILREFFTKHSHMFEWNEPKAGTVCFPLLKQLPAALQGRPLDGGSLKAVDSKAYCDWLVAQYGIMLLPASVYTHCDSPCFRLGFGRANLPQVVKKWEATLSADEERV